LIQTGPLQRIPRVQRLSSNFLFDTQRFTTTETATAQTFELYANPIGQTGNGFTPKTEAETNMTRERALPNNNSFEVHQIGVLIVPVLSTGATTAPAIDDCNAILRNCAMRFTSGELQRRYGPALLWPGGAGVSGAFQSEAAGASDQGWAINGVPAAGARVGLHEPIILKPGQTFGWSLNLVRGFTQIVTGASYDFIHLMWGNELSTVVDG
jgi:hypothetical protein